MLLVGYARRVASRAWAPDHAKGKLGCGELGRRTPDARHRVVMGSALRGES